MVRLSRILLPIVIICGTAVLFVGCQSLLNTGENPEASTTPTTDLFTGVSPTLQPTVSPTPVMTKTITIWLPPRFDPENGSPAGNLLSARLAAFSAQHPDILVNVRIKAEEGVSGLLNTLTTADAAAPAVLPGLILLMRSDFEQAAENGLLSPVQPVPGSAEGGLFSYADQLSLVNGTRYGIPFAGDGLALAYRTDQVNAAPRNWHDLTHSNSTVLFPAADQQGLLLAVLYLGSGGSFVDENGEVSLQEESIRSALDLLHSGIVTGVFPYWLIETSTYDQSWQGLLDARAGNSIVWTSQYLQNKPDNIAISILPSPAVDPFTLADGCLIAIPVNSPVDYEVSRELALFLTDPSFQQSWIETAGYLPISKTGMEKWTDQELARRLFDIADSARPIPSNKVIEKYGPVFEEVTIDMFQGQAGVDQALGIIIETTNPQ